MIWNKFLLVIENKPHKNKYKILMGIFGFAATLVIIVFLSKYFIPEKRLAIQFTIMITMFSMVIYVLIYCFQMDVDNKGILKNILIIISILLFLITPICMKMEYDNAKNQNVFSIIEENFDECKQFYVVISEGKEKYSAYLCKLNKDNEGILTIITDVHKSFDINDTKTIIVEFNEIKRAKTKPLTVKDLIIK
ncbi:hypothetical protein JYG23_13670 [Sedimentibacter sp. zth1]|uniref:hypothetical protein n=1 Tax=Sedimentibacter sp. zth1 TaxID=2816908 RepID=UPI001A91B73C|nr:hypothetical protein [Sedimentibacter sp. zth1]QSX05695.1 hypothetical protein JYG23_13670 [Sedimentibacter sp. zth1]